MGDLSDISCGKPILSPARNFVIPNADTADPGGPPGSLVFDPVDDRITYQPTVQTIDPYEIAPLNQLASLDGMDMASSDLPVLSNSGSDLIGFDDPNGDLGGPQSVRSALAALAAGGGGGGITTLAALTDTTISGPTIGQVLLYDGIDSWDNEDPPFILTADIGSAVQAWDQKLEDISGLSPATGALIRWDGTNFVSTTGVLIGTSEQLVVVATSDVPVLTVKAGTATPTNPLVLGKRSSGVDIYKVGYTGNTEITLSADEVGLRITANASQTAELLQIRNSSGVALLVIDPSGHLELKANTEARFFDDGGENYVALKGPVGLGVGSSPAVTWNLPAADGQDGYSLKTDGAGVLSFGLPVRVSDADGDTYLTTEPTADADVHHFYSGGTHCATIDWSGTLGRLFIDNIRSLGGTQVQVFDSEFRIRDETTSTKIAVFQCSSLSATRTFTFPNSSGTLVLNSNSQAISGIKTFAAGQIFEANSGAGSILLRDDAAVDSVGLTAPAAVGTSYVLVLPADVGAKNMALVTTNATGTLGFKNPRKVDDVQTGKVTYVIEVTDGVIGADTTGSAPALTLPDLDTYGYGIPLWIKDTKGNAAASSITVNRGGSDTIDGATSIELSSNHAAVCLMGIESGIWSIISAYGTLS